MTKDRYWRSILAELLWPILWILAMALALGYSPRLRAEASLTLYYYPSETKIHWKRPSLLAASILWSEITAMLTPETYRRYTLGHVHVAIQCDTPHNGMTEVFTGMTNKDNLEMNNAVLKRGLGLGVLFYPFEGRFETDEEVKKKIAMRMKWRRSTRVVDSRNSTVRSDQHHLLKSMMRVSFVKLRIQESNCHRLLEYVQEYRSRKIHEVYGLHADPLNCEGAGCSAYGRSFLKVAGLLDKSLSNDPVVRFLIALDDAAMKVVRVPQKLIGDDSKGHFVNIFEMASRGVHWAEDDEPARELVFWDPSYWHNALMEALYDPERSTLRSLFPETTQFEKLPSHRPRLYPKGRGVILDARHIQVDPSIPIFSPACN